MKKRAPRRPDPRPQVLPEASLKRIAAGYAAGKYGFELDGVDCGYVATGG
jgi:hypothetical protein